ncbi:glycosyltransferase family 9 protein [candidate division KSB1 bacterium]|nr:glycosyltransferase family 9 protein [candidate division KSB1 bacterium]
MRIRRILISRLRFMGDVILTTPAVHALRQAYPDARITYLAEAPFAELLLHHPDIDDVLVVQKNNSKAMRQLFMKLLTSRFDIAIDLFCNPRSAILIWFSGARIRIGGEFRGRRLLYNRLIPFESIQRNAVDFHLNYLSPLNIVYNKVEPFIQITDEEKEWARSYLRRQNFDLSRPIVGLHPGATWPAKQWLPERFAMLADRIVRDLNAQVLFTMGPNEVSLLRSVLKQCSSDLKMPELLSLRQLAAVLHCMAAFVSNDCGPLHLAPAVGTAVVGIFGPGTPEIWFPYRADLGHRLVFHTLDCSRCNRDFCEKLDCMKAITVDDVFKAVSASLQRN